MRPLRILSAGFVCAGLICAQNAKPAIGCGDLRSLTNNEVSIATALLVPAAPDAPEHCRVGGQVLPQVGFEVSLPTQWNGRFYMFGNGGYAGEALDSPARRATAARAMRRGYATAQTDTGHSAANEPLGTFAADRQKLLDYAFRSLHVTAEAAKLVVRTYYGGAPARSYFEGCSTGGRQGLILAQRFPADFDGIVVGAPVLNFSTTMVAYANNIQALRAAPIPAAKLPLLAEKIYAQCDARDGLKDGLIDDPRRCGFQPSRDLPKCDAGDQPGCFTAGQIGALEKIYSDVVSQGKRIFPGWPVGAEIAGSNGRSGWEPWFVSDAGPTTDVAFSEAFFRYLAFGKPDPKYDLSQFNLDRDPPRLGAIHQILDATDTDLARFEQRGGKILMYFGWADPALNPLMGVEYYEQVSQRMGAATGGFFRLFMVPGMFHCNGGVGADTFDKLGPLADWVEHGTPPDAIPASRIAAGMVVRTRPLCAYPEVARYKGTGSIDDAANFACVKP
jgi:Tannase and feruloyl esterase